MSRIDIHTPAAGDWVGWIQHGGPQWGRLIDVGASFRVDAGQGPRQVRAADVAVVVAKDIATSPDAIAAEAGGVSAALAWQGLLARFGDQPFTVAEAAAALAMPQAKSGALWLCLWQAPESFARIGRTQFRARGMAEQAAESVKIADRRHEETVLNQLETDWAACQRRERSFTDLVLSQPDVEQLARALCQGEGGPRLSDRGRARAEKILLAAHDADGAAWPFGYALASALGDADPWQSGDPRLSAQQRWLKRYAGQSAAWTGLALSPLTSLWAIDDEGTADRDDAIGFAADGDAITVEIAIADVTAGAVASDDVRQEAVRTATTIYLPTGQIPMLPPAIGAGAHSLTGAAARPVILLRLHIGADGAWLAEPQLERGLLQLAGTASYVDVDAGRVVPAEWSTALAAAGRLHARRVAAGAENVQVADVAIDVRDGHPVGYRRLEPWHGARLVVREAMIAANHAFAQLLKSSRLAAPFRSIQANAETMIAKVDVRPATHQGLGVPCYVYATSPIRRFADILAQIQLVSLLGGKAMPESAMRNWIERQESSFHASKRWMDQALRYWKLRYLESKPDTKLSVQPEPRHNDLRGTTRVRLLPLDIVLYVQAELQPSRGPVPVRLSNVDADRNQLSIELDR